MTGVAWRVHYSDVGRVLCACAYLAACSTRSEVGQFEPTDAGGDAAAFDAGLDASLALDPSLARLSLGNSSSCVLDSQGGVQCFGDNTFGQLGVDDISLSGSSQPLVAKGLATGVRAVFGGPVSHCAVLQTGNAMCWGESVFGSFNGQPGTHFATPAPFEAPGLSFVASMALGIYFHCALATNGSAKCYGLNSSGQLGTGGLGDNFTPASVASLEPSRHIAAAGFFACAVTGAGSVKCWGHNDHGQLGDGTQQDALAPVPVVGLPPVATSVANGRDHACALAEGNVWCWGGNAYGQLGTGPSADRALPVQVSGLSTIVQITAGNEHTCARSDGGAVHCWGAADSGSSTSGPLAIVPADAVEVAAGGRHSCALLGSGVLRCWGSGGIGIYGGSGAPAP